MKPTDLRGILQYIPRFREKTFILALDGAIVTDENFANILLDIAVLRSLNIRASFWFTAPPRKSKRSQRNKSCRVNLDGVGVTDTATLKLFAHGGGTG